MIKETSAGQLMRSILTRVRGVASFALLLGSGASATSHVKTAQEMIDEWRWERYKGSGSEVSFEDWLSQQEWYNSDDEYATLFSFMYKTASLRRDYIENCLRDAYPTWGYAYLTNLLKHNIFNVVFTTNFDDLINEACFLHSDVRPVVCAHDSAVSKIRITAARPKIIKLHGDFLFDSIKTTRKELESLEDNMQRKFMHFAQEYGLVVVGYSGRDESVMSILDSLIRKNEEYFTRGLYWCEREEGEEERSRRLSSLLQKDNVYLVKIGGFDEFMAELSHEAGCGLPKQVVEPLWVAEDRARLFLSVPGSVNKSKIINEDRNKVLEAIAQASSFKIIDEHLPSSLRAAALRQKRDLESALEEVEKAYAQNMDDTSIAWEKASLLDRLDKRDELQELIKARPLGKDPIWDSTKSYFLLRTNDNKGAKAIAAEVLDSHPRDHIARINRAIALKRLGRHEAMEKELSNLEGRRIKEDIRAGIAALRRDKNEMLFLLEKALDKGLITPDQVEMFVVFEDYWGDNDLVNLLARKGHNGLDKNEGI